MAHNSSGKVPNRERLPEGVRRLTNRRLRVEFERRFSDGTAFRRTKEFEPDALKAAIGFLERAQADFARGNGAGDPAAADGPLTVGAWCEHCVHAVMPAQRNGRSPKYGDEALQGFRDVVRRYVLPNLGEIPLDRLDKRTVADFVAALPSDEVRAKALNLLTRAMELAETKGKRKKGTNPCKGVSPHTKTASAGPKSWTPPRPADWRDEPEREG